MFLDWKLSCFETSAYEAQRLELKASKEEKKWYTQSSDCSMANTENSSCSFGSRHTWLFLECTKFSPLLFSYPSKPTTFYCISLICFTDITGLFFVGRWGAAVIFCCCFLIWFGFVKIEGCRNPMPSKFVWVLHQQYLLISCFCVTVVIGIISQILYQKKKKILFTLDSNHSIF